MQVERQASVFEFVEGPAQPKLTKKMQFLLQASVLKVALLKSR